MVVLQPFLAIFLIGSKVMTQMKNTLKRKNHQKHSTDLFFTKVETKMEIFAFCVITFEATKI